MQVEAGRRLTQVERLSSRENRQTAGRASDRLLGYESPQQQVAKAELRGRSRYEHPVTCCRSEAR